MKEGHASLLLKEAKHGREANSKVGSPQSQDSAVTFNVLGNGTDEQNNIVAGATAAPTSPSAGTLSDNGSGGVTTTSFDLTVSNVAPSSVGITGPAIGYVGDVVTVTLTATDVSTADQAAGFTYEIDWDGNGSVDETLNGPSGLTAEGTDFIHFFLNGNAGNGGGNGRRYFPQKRPRWLFSAPETVVMDGRMLVVWYPARVCGSLGPRVDESVEDGGSHQCCDDGHDDQRGEQFF